MKQKPFSLTAAHLRILALFLMLVDHLGRTVFPQFPWMMILGRLAFPIFAFQTAEGYVRTHDFGRYCGRLALFAVLSEIPFNLMVKNAPIYPLHQNVMLTMLLGLLACRAYDRRKWGQMLLWLLAGSVSCCDYGIMGVWTVLMFHIFRGQKPAQLLMLALINLFGFGGSLLTLGFFRIPAQAFAILAIVPIFLYNGEKGRGGKALQYGSYIFYPLHMLILGLM